MTKPLYPVPDCLKSQCEQPKYSRWLHRKAVAHVKRDKKRDRQCTVARYKSEMHDAIRASQGKDFYTGDLLDFSLVSKWDNESAKKGRTGYKKRFASLPTIDHAVDEQGKQKFVVCSMSVNDAKGDLSLEEFYNLCERVLKHREKRSLDP